MSLLEPRSVTYQLLSASHGCSCDRLFIVGTALLLALGFERIPMINVAKSADDVSAIREIPLAIRGFPTGDIT